MSDAAPATPTPGATDALGSEAVVATPHASRYLQQLCKHFAHKIPATFDAQRGHLAFDFGTCDLEADAEALRLRIVAPDGTDLARLADVVQRHLVRFAFREDLAIRWETA